MSYRFDWRVGERKNLERGFGVYQSSRERAFVLAACRSMNSGQTQHVRNIRTGEEWRVRIGIDSDEIRRLKEPRLCTCGHDGLEAAFHLTTCMDRSTARGES